MGEKLWFSRGKEGCNLSFFRCIQGPRWNLHSRLRVPSCHPNWNKLVMVVILYSKENSARMRAGQCITSSGIWSKERLRARSSDVDRGVLAKRPRFSFEAQQVLFSRGRWGGQSWAGGLRLVCIVSFTRVFHWLRLRSGTWARPQGWPPFCGSWYMN